MKLLMQELQFTMRALAPMELNFDKEDIAEEIIKLICDTFRITPEALRSKLRTREMAVCRQIAMYLIKNNTSYNLTQISKLFNRDHSTVIYSIESFENSRLTGDRTLMSYMEKLSPELYKNNLCV